VSDLSLRVGEQEIELAFLKTAAAHFAETGGLFLGPGFRPVLQ
jgi:hypothetical protein